MKKTIALLLGLILSVSLLAGCGGGGSAAPTGKYFMTAMELEGEDIFALYTEMGLSADNLYIELLSGGKCKISMMDETGEGTFKVDGKTITISADGEEAFAGAIEGNKITLEEDGNKMVFEKK